MFKTDKCTLITMLMNQIDKKGIITLPEAYDDNLKVRNLLRMVWGKIHCD